MSHHRPLLARVPMRAFRPLLELGFWSGCRIRNGQKFCGISTRNQFSVERIGDFGSGGEGREFGMDLVRGAFYCAGRGTMVIASHGQIFTQSVQPVQTAGSLLTFEVSGSSLMRTRQLSHGATAMQASQPVHWS